MRGDLRYGCLPVNMQNPSQRTKEPSRYFPLSNIVEAEVSKFLFQIMNDAAYQTEEKPPMTFVILHLLGSDVEDDYILRIWALGILAT